MSNDYLAIKEYIQTLPRGENIPEEMECLICKESVKTDVENNMRNDRKLPCAENCKQSVYHEECLLQWIERNPKMNNKCLYCNHCYFHDFPSMLIPTNEIDEFEKKNMKMLVYFVYFESIMYLALTIPFLHKLKYHVDFCYLFMTIMIAHIPFDIPNLPNLEVRIQTRFMWVYFVVDLISIGITYKMNQAKILNGYYADFNFALTVISITFVLLFLQTRTSLYFMRRA